MGGFGLGGLPAALAATEPDSVTIGGASFARRAARKDAPNVIYISLDDMNDWVGYLGPADREIGRLAAHTPNLDALAARSALMNHAYAPVPMCLSSRVGIVTGRSPVATGVAGRNTFHLDTRCDDGPNRACASTALADNGTIFDSFWLDGYRTVSTGKIIHGGHLDRSVSRHGPFFDVVETEALQLDSVSQEPGFGQLNDSNIFWSAPSIESQVDDLAVAVALEEIADHAAGRRSRPLFLAAGIYLPHLPWRPPQWAWDANDVPFDPTPLDEALADLDDVPDIVKNGRNTTKVDLSDSSPNAGSQQDRLTAMHAYLASITYADHLVGRILDAVNNSPMADNTIVAIWSDHGWHLGHKYHWKKMALWEQATRIPMLIHAPGRQGFTEGNTFSAPISALDLYPTLAELCDVPLATPLRNNRSKRVVNGASVDNMDGRSAVKRIQLGANGRNNPALMTFGWDNYGVRRGKWHLIRYGDGSKELYNINNDPAEYNNLANDPARAKTISTLESFMPAIGERSFA